MADQNIILQQYQAPGVCKFVTETTISPTHRWLATTATEQLDELLDQLSFYRYMVAGNGAVLEAASDGLRVATQALAEGLSGGSGDKIRVDINKQPRKALEATGIVLWQDPTTRELWSSNVTDLTGVTSGPYSILGNNTAASKNAEDLTKLNIPNGVADTLIGFSSNGSIVQTATISQEVNLSHTLNSLQVKVETDTGGDSTVIEAAVPNGNAGIMTGLMAWQLDYLINNQVNLGITHTGLNVIIQDGSGLQSQVVINYATPQLAGVMTAQDKQKLDSLTVGGGPSNVDLSLVRSATTNVVVNSAGDDCTLLLVDASYAGLMAPGQRQDLIDLKALTYDLSYQQNAADNDVTLSTTGSSIKLLPVTDTLAGLMTPTDKVLLDSLSTSSTNLGVTRSPTWVNITNSVGTDALMQPADYLSNVAGVFTADNDRVLENLRNASSNSILTTFVTGEPSWKQKNGFTQFQHLDTTRFLGFKDTGELGIFQVSTSGGGGPSSLTIKQTAHSLVAGDIGKPIVDGQVWDDTGSTWPSGLLLEIVDADNVRIAQQNEMFTLAASLVEGGYDPVTDGKWLAWDKSAGTYVAVLPGDSASGVTEALQILEANGSDWYALWHDHGPLGAGTTSPGGGGGTPTPDEVVLSNGVPAVAPSGNESLAVDYANNDFYYNNAGSWSKVADSMANAAASSTQNIANVHTLLCDFGSDITIDTLSGGEAGQELTIIFRNQYGLVENNANIQCPYDENFDPGSTGGSITLVYDGTKWWTKSAVDYTTATFLMAG